MTDRRIQRTQTAFEQALLRLMEHHPFDAISVVQIAQEANMARATFYLHYADKQDLLWQAVERIFAELGDTIGSIDPETLLAQGQRLSYPIFAHVAEHEGFYRAALGEAGVMPFLLRLKRYIAAQSKRHHAPLRRAAPQEPSVPPDFTAHFLAGAAVGIILWWLEEQPDHPPEDLAELFTALAAPGVLAALGLTG